MMKGRCLQSFIRTFGDADDERSVDFHCKNIDFASSTSDRLGWEAATSAPTTPIAEVIDSPSPSSCCTALFHSLCSLIRLHCGEWKEGRKKKSFWKTFFRMKNHETRKQQNQKAIRQRIFCTAQWTKHKKKWNFFHQHRLRVCAEKIFASGIYESVKTRKKIEFFVWLIRPHSRSLNSAV